MIGINTNNSALAASAKISSNAVEQTAVMQRLSTGVRVNSAKDDAAALAISTGLISQIKGMAVATRNVADGISLAQTAESALGSVVNMLQRMRELAVQSANGTLTTANRAAIQLEYDANINQINTVLGTTNFNGIKLFDGSASALSIQSGSTLTNKDTISIPKLINPSDTSGSSNSISGGAGAGAGNAQVGGVNGVNNNNSNVGYTDYLQFDGTGQNITGTIANIPIGNSPRTFELTVQINTIQSAQNGTIFHYGDINNIYQNYALRLYNGNLVFWAGCADYLVSSNINDNLQHKIALTFDGNNMSWYLDNNLIGSSAVPHTDDANLLALNNLEAANFNQINTAANTQFVIGTLSNGSDSTKGKIKQLAIFNTALTQSQIAALPTSLTGTEPNLVANYDFQNQKTVTGSPVAATILNSVNNGDPLTYNGWTLQQAPPAQAQSNSNQQASADNIVAHKLGTVDLTKTTGPDDAIKACDLTIEQVTNIRTYLGAMQNSLQAVIDNLTSSGTNAQQANGRQIDTDYAETTTQLSRNQIISQAATAMLAQANQSSQLVLQLLKP